MIPENNEKTVSKKGSVKLTIFIFSIMMLVGSLSYAFFVAATGDPGITDFSLGSEITESLIFTAGNKIDINATAATFEQTDISPNSSTTSRAKLIADSTIESASRNYYVYFNISKNTFIYTVDTNTPELILTITGPDGLVENIDGLNFVTTTDVKGTTISGFDVTSYEGLIKIKEMQEISTVSSDTGTTQSWTAKLTFVNLNSIQTGNEGKTFDSELILRETEMFYINEGILENNGGASAIESYPAPDFSQVATTNEGMFAASDDYGTSYYFRGAVDDNWVKFADMYWRVIRINGDGSVRMIYSGTTAPTAEEAVVMTGDGTHIGTSAFNSVYDNAEYTGYMYTIGEQHGLSTDSTAKQTIDTWYENNILGTEYETKLSDTLFCGDRTAYTDSAGTTQGTGIGKSSLQYFGGYINNYKNNTPSLECPSRLDAYTVSDTTNGNGALEYPLGMITSDEIALAGGKNGLSNSSYYLYSNNHYWAISPHIYSNPSAKQTMMHTTGNLNLSQVDSPQNIRIVLSLNSNTLSSGTGTWDDPYLIN